MKNLFDIKNKAKDQIIDTKMLQAMKGGQGDPPPWGNENRASDPPPFGVIH